MVADGKMIDVVKPSRVKPGDPVNVDATIKNTGDITGTFKLKMTFDGTPVVSTPSFDLDPGASQQQTLSYNTPLLGTSVGVELNLYKVLDIADFDALEPYLVSGCIGEHWWEFTEPERRRIAETAIKSTLFYYVNKGRSGASNCVGGTGDIHTLVCLHNAEIRLLKFGTGVPGADNCYYFDKSGVEHCYVPDERFNLPCYFTNVMGPNFGHGICAIKVNEDIDDLNSWIFFQYSTFDIKPGDWQIPTTTHDYIDIYIYNTTGLGCGSQSGSKIKTFHLTGE